ncbi:MAG: DUF4838 domain-containing protein [Verrucomicrobiota bacterium]
MSNNHLAVAILTCSAALCVLLSDLVSAAIIVDNGKTDYVIVLCSKPIPAEQTAAKELQAYLAKSTGVVIPIVDESSLESSKAAIMIGPTAFAQENGVEPQGPEEWTIKTIRNRLVLTGGRPRGTLYSVYHFLEDHVGVRWWTIWEESVPQIKNLSIKSIDRSGKPGFAYREIYDAGIPGPKLFYARNRVNGMFSSIPWEYGGTVEYGPPYHVHTFEMYFPPGKYFATHPEYYSLSNGKRIDKGQLCLTNKDLLREWIVKMKDYIRTSYAAADAAGTPRPIMFSISQNDWAGSCECDNCKSVWEKEGHAGLELTFVNAVAEEVGKEFPDVLIDTLAYSFYLTPPKTIKPRDNVCVRVCDDPGDIMHGIGHPNNKLGLQNLEGWAKITKHLRVWDYHIIYSPNLPTPSQFNTAADMRLYKHLGVEGVLNEIEGMLTTDMWDMKVWMLAKTMEDPDANSDKLIREFTDGYYGPAGRFIRKYLGVIKKALDARPVYITFIGNVANYTFLDKRTILVADAMFDKAEAAVADNPILLDRVRFARTSLDRAICLRFRNLYQENNEDPAASPLKISPKVSSNRAAQILRKIAKQRLQDKPEHVNPWNTPEGALAEAKMLEDISNTMVVAPLPEQFKGYARGSVADFPCDMFRIAGTTISNVTDTDSVYGVTSKLTLADISTENIIGANRAGYIISDSQPMQMGHYNPKNRKFSPPCNIRPGDIKPGYNLYKCGPFRMDPSEYFYLFWSWWIQMDLEGIRTDDPNQEYEVYASIKFEGPSFPAGGSLSKPDAICVDRIIAVRMPKQSRLLGYLLKLKNWVTHFPVP